MAEIAEHNTKKETCDVAGCNNEAERSLNVKLVSQSSLKLKEGDHRSVHLCKEHYKEYKKETKTSRGLDSVY
jgi:hypothetical protein